jgi:hypothetical protein
MATRQTMSSGGFGTLGGRPTPPDLLALLVVAGVTFVCQFFASTAGWLPALRLTRAVWQEGWVWQLLTYPFIGFGAPSLWVVLQFFLLFWFGRDVFARLGRARFWRTTLAACVGAGCVALAVEAGLGAAGLWPERSAFLLLQGQQILLTVIVAAFATLYASTTLLLFFVVPVRAIWFLGLEILLGFLGFLWSKDLGGFLGICTAVGLTYALLAPRQARGLPRRLWLRLEKAWLDARLAWLRRRRGIKVIQGGKGGRPGPFVH